MMTPTTGMKKKKRENAGTPFSARTQQYEANDSPSFQEFISVTTTSTTTSRKEPTTRQLYGKEYGVNLVDYKTGKPYYYDFETCESKWGIEPSSPKTEETKKASNLRSITTDSIQGDWIRLTDSRGREFEYNKKTCASRWVRD
jgi:hypothetical protein